jgi:phosphatidylinositol alpha-mannosyltransferase
VLDLAAALRAAGHQARVLAPTERDTPLPEFVTSGGRATAIPYNGSVARLAFGPVAFGRVRAWLRAHDFDVLHLHEPNAPSLSMLTLMLADGPIVATCHAAKFRSRTLLVARGMLQPFLEKITAWIAVSTPARRVQVEHLGGDAVEIPNGVDVSRYASARALPGDQTRRVVFVGRYDEPRKGMSVLLEALGPLSDRVELVVVGPGDAPRLAARSVPVPLTCLGALDDAGKARALRGSAIFCAPNLGGESFGMVLTEAMAAGCAVVASDLDAFRRVLGDAGVLVPVGSAPALREAVAELLTDPSRRAWLASEARRRVAVFDWPVVADQVVKVYEAATAAHPRISLG